MRIPDGTEALSAEWLTEALRAGDAIHDSRVVSFQARPIGSDEAGLTSRLTRLRLIYDREEHGAPRNLIYKCHTDASELRANAAQLDIYRREVRFYQEAAGQVELRTPRCYYADFREDQFFVLLLEDMAPAKTGLWAGDNLLERAGLALREIAKFHAAWWASPRLEGMDWLMGYDPEEVRRFYAFAERWMREVWEQVLAKVGTTLSPAVIEIGARARDHLAWTCNQVFTRPPRTLLHWDYHLDNIFFASSEGGGSSGGH